MINSIELRQHPVPAYSEIRISHVLNAISLDISQPTGGATQHFARLTALKLISVIKNERNTLRVFKGGKTL